MLIFTSFSRIFRGIFSAVGTFFSLNSVLLWDIGLTFINLVTPKKKIGHVVPKDKPGHKGIWPEYIAPMEGDSRSSCPALNALCNHGILPRDGKNIPFKQMGDVIHDVYNFAPSFCYFVPWYVSQFLQRDYKRDTLNLNDIDVHNCIEHDGSICRHDAKMQPDQSKPALDLIHDFLASATGDDGQTITPSDLSKFLEKRRAHSKIHNPQYTLSTGQRLFGSSNASTLLLFFGGNVSDLRTFLTEERLPENWETKARSKKGMTITSFNGLVNKVEFGIDERRGLREMKASMGAEGVHAHANVNGAGETNGVKVGDVHGSRTEASAV